MPIPDRIPGTPGSEDAAPICQTQWALDGGGGKPVFSSPEECLGELALARRDLDIFLSRTKKQITGDPRATPGKGKRGIVYATSSWEQLHSAWAGIKLLSSSLLQTTRDSDGSAGAGGTGTGTSGTSTSGETLTHTKILVSSHALALPIEFHVPKNIIDRCNALYSTGSVSGSERTGQAQGAFANHNDNDTTDNHKLEALLIRRINGVLKAGKTVDFNRFKPLATQAQVGGSALSDDDTKSIFDGFDVNKDGYLIANEAKLSKVLRHRDKNQGQEQEQERKNVHPGGITCKALELPTEKDLIPNVDVDGTGTGTVGERMLKTYVGIRSQAILHSDFDDIIYLDPNSFPFIDPNILLDSTEYKSTGAVFLHGPWGHSCSDKQFHKAGKTSWPQHVLWRLFDANSGIKPNTRGVMPFKWHADRIHGQDWDTHFFAINKQIHASAIELSNWLCKHPFVARVIEGRGEQKGKEQACWRLAMLATAVPLDSNFETFASAENRNINSGTLRFHVVPSIPDLMGLENKIEGEGRKDFTSGDNSEFEQRGTMNYFQDKPLGNHENYQNYKNCQNYQNIKLKIIVFLHICSSFCNTQLLGVHVSFTCPSAQYSHHSLFF